MTSEHRSTSPSAKVNDAEIPSSARDDSPQNSGSPPAHIDKSAEINKELAPALAARNSSVATSSLPEDHEAVEDDHQEAAGRQDLERADTSASTGPPHSVFTSKQKVFIMLMTAWGNFFSPLSGSIYFPALNVLARDLHVSSSTINLTLTTYMILQGIAPTFVGTFADNFGRRPTYIVCIIVFIGACTGIALQNSFAALMILRCVQSAGSSGTVSLGSGVAADIATSAERGMYIGWISTGSVMGPALGPILGGILAQFLGWRSIFWFLVILAGVWLIPYSIAVPETGRKVVGNGSIPPPTWNMSLLNWLQIRRQRKAEAAKAEAEGIRPDIYRTKSRESIRSARSALNPNRKLRFPNPMASLKVLMEKDAGLLLLYNSIVFLAVYDVQASLPYMFAEIYKFNDLQIGLCYIPFGVGGFLAPMLNGWVLDLRFRRIAKSEGITITKGRNPDLKGFPIEKARIPVAYPLVIVACGALICYGWFLEYNLNLAAPLVMTFTLGLTLTACFNMTSVMLIDYHPTDPSTAVAANNLVRCLLGAAGTACIIQMIDGMGRGWCFTFLAALIFLSSGILLVLLKKGPQWREERRVKAEAKKQQEEEAKRAPITEK